MKEGELHGPRFKAEVRWTEFWQVDCTEGKPETRTGETGLYSSQAELEFRESQNIYGLRVSSRHLQFKKFTM